MIEKGAMADVHSAVHSLAADEASADVRRNFSKGHLSAVDHFADVMREHEAANFGKGWGPHYSVCRWHGTAALVLSFSAIEAALDEAEEDLGLPSELSEALGKAATLHHVQALLVHRGGKPFEKGAAPYQDAELLRKLRNALVHPKVEWDSAKKNHKKLSQIVCSSGLPLSPFQQDPELAFPVGCMSAGVARWAANTARSFIFDMRERLGLAN